MFTPVERSRPLTSAVQARTNIQSLSIVQMYASHEPHGTRKYTTSGCGVRRCAPWDILSQTYEEHKLREIMKTHGLQLHNKRAQEASEASQQTLQKCVYITVLLLPTETSGILGSAQQHPIYRFKATDRSYFDVFTKCAHFIYGGWLPKYCHPEYTPTALKSCLVYGTNAPNGLYGLM